MRVFSNLTLLEFEARLFFVVRVVLCITGCLEASLGSIHQMPGASPLSSLRQQKMFSMDCQMFQGGGKNCPQLKTTALEQDKLTVVLYHKFVFLKIVAQLYIGQVEQFDATCTLLEVFDALSTFLNSSICEWDSVELLYCPLKLLGNMELIHTHGIEAGRGIRSQFIY